MSVIMFIAGLVAGIVVSAICSGAVDKWLDRKKDR